jgi:hypothetical protein
MTRSDGQWRDLPLGHYRWIEIGVLDEMLAMLVRDADMEWLSLDRLAILQSQAPVATLPDEANH